MVVFGKWKNGTVTISLKPNSLTISLQAGADSRVFSFDGAGRLWTAMLQDVSYRRGLNGRIVAKWQTYGNGRERRWLLPQEAAALEETARLTTVELLADIHNGAAALQSPLPPDDLSMLDKAAAFHQQRYQQDVQTYQQVYQPVGILPPDQYMAVVLQATEGCSFNTCTFCNFYRGGVFILNAGTSSSRTR